VQIIDSETFTKTEDHEILLEKKRYELEHRCVCNHSCCCAPLLTAGTLHLLLQLIGGPEQPLH